MPRGVQTVPERASVYAAPQPNTHTIPLWNSLDTPVMDRKGVNTGGHKLMKLIDEVFEADFFITNRQK